MGTMIFLLPTELSPDAAYELERAWVAGHDRIPWPTHVQVDRNRLIVQRHASESGYLVVPWSMEGVGRVMATSSTLMDQHFPYHLELELARGKVKQLRSQAAQWQEKGLLLPA